MEKTDVLEIGRKESLITRSIMEQLDEIPYVKEFEYVCDDLSIFYRGIIPYVSGTNGNNDLRYAFCHVLQKTAKHNEVFILDDLPSLEISNMCRDFFVKQVFGDLRLKFNDLSLQVNVSEEIGNSLSMLINKATAILCSGPKTYDWPHT